MAAHTTDALTVLDIMNTLTPRTHSIRPRTADAFDVRSYSWLNKQPGTGAVKDPGSLV